MIIQHNLQALNANRQLNNTSLAKAKSTEKLSSGYRINRAADDAAGLAISEKMRRQIRGLTRGVENTEEGVSMCKVADGALAEVSSMLHRITELSVQSANDTNSPEDRHYLQQEVNRLIEEIDRIGEETEFNEIPIFQGNDTIITNDDGTIITEGDISFSDLSLSTVDLGTSPLAGGSANYLGLQAIVNNDSLPTNGTSYNLIYSNGGTSNASVRVSSTIDGAETTIPLSSFTVGATTATSANSWKRDLTYNNGLINITLTQNISTSESATQKDYNMSYSFRNNGNSPIFLDFMFHADTAYNNNDTCEGYYTDNGRVDKMTVYASNPGSTLIPKSNPTNAANSNIKYGTLPSSFSIVDVDNALAFSEKITINGANKPDILSVGIYSAINGWNYYSSGNLASNLGQNSEHTDLGFSLIWENKSIAKGASWTADFKYGIADVEHDANLKDTPIFKSDDAIMSRENRRYWIQSGSEQWVGMYLEFGEMNSSILGLDMCNITTQEGASSAIEQVKKSLYYISDMRSKIGAQQNRLESTVRNENNIIENTTAAESAIRDTDMAAEMVKYSLANIVEQAGTSMLAQANQLGQNVLSLLQ